MSEVGGLSPRQEAQLGCWASGTRARSSGTSAALDSLGWVVTWW